MMKDSALVSFLGNGVAQMEIFRRAQLVGRASFRNLEALIVAALDLLGAHDRVPVLPGTTREATVEGLRPRRRDPGGEAEGRPGSSPAAGWWRRRRSRDGRDTHPRGRGRARPGRGHRSDRGRRARVRARAGSRDVTAADDVVLRVEDLHKTFGHLEVLKGIDMEVHRGEVIVVFGRSGSGKSTLLRCINFLEEPTSGTIEVAGIKLEGGHRTRHKREQIRQLRIRAGMVFQDFQLFPHMSTVHNVMEGPVTVKGKSEDEARGLATYFLERVGMADKAEEYPDPALRRPEAARRHRPGARDGARGDALRRADVGAGPRTDRRGPRGHEVARDRAPHDDDGRHPRDGLRARGRESRRVLPRGDHPRGGVRRSRSS